MKIYVTKHANTRGIMVYDNAEIINDNLVMLTPTTPLNGRRHWHKKKLDAEIRADEMHDDKFYAQLAKVRKGLGQSQAYTT